MFLRLPCSQLLAIFFFPHPNSSFWQLFFLFLSLQSDILPLYLFWADWSGSEKTCSYIFVIFFSSAGKAIRRDYAITNCSSSVCFFINFCSNAISSEVYGPNGFKYYVRHPGEGIYQSYGNYADATIFSSAESLCVSQRLCRTQLLCHPATSLASSS